MQQSKTQFIKEKVQEGKSVTVEWEPLAPAGPCVAFHAACIIRGSLFIHGGVTEKDSKLPSSGLHKLDLKTCQWTELRAPGSPTLSHHTAVPLEERYIILIGGWNGRVRTPEVHVYDVKENQWVHVTTVGFPDGAGLSSHTASCLSSGDILVIGREGSLRTQRRHGNVYLLSGKISSGKFCYTEYSSAVSSRSGHSASFVGSKLCIIGGRSDNLLEVMQGFKSPPESTCKVMSALAEAVKAKCFRSLTKMPCGRKNHSAVSGSGVLFIHGGETFDGRIREPVGQMMLLAFTPLTQFYDLGISRLGRAGHVCCHTEDAIVMHGGLSGKSSVHGDAYQLFVHT
ncbi:kelch domain-containing protein 9-like isoform X1 [Pomacea canaliculata]|uniref:kelch domain-containing protein 9-like isoform X1 n=1 Tax=Pomacea canaliculata TaxID=400727 RepID=UPI000D73C946|nr:kelch domain-containing protein 9-like isoform X1 [Pomacea canaliculata]XP_025091284.1 kelch domain-containing protein 9-like isoform X1 [Pomacea canaliculata]XP_025091285.1 kelch domain-containing protein 9-like isoform X1 [Pomacea canaliculata]